MDIIYQATSINKKIVDKKPETYTQLYASILKYKTKIIKISKHCKETTFYKTQKKEAKIKNEEFYNAIKKTCHTRPNLVCSLYAHLNNEFQVLKKQDKEKDFLKKMAVSIVYMYPLLELAFKEKF